MAPPDDPVLTACKHKLAHFRIKELKDVLHQLGLPKQGKKQELSERVMTTLYNHQDHVSGREVAVKIVEDTFSKMQDSTTTVAASRSHIESGHSAKPKKKLDDSSEMNVKVRCPCGNSKPNDPMIKCFDPQCNIRQHIGCVVIPENEKSADNFSPDLPSCFYCEMCRISRADPFWVTINNLLLPVLIGPSTIAADGSYTVQYTTKSFQLSRANREMLQKSEYDIQVWCILMNDKVPFRMHWPLHSDMQVNGIHVRVVSRQPSQKLGANGRDDGPLLTDYLREGPNKIALSRNDSRTFCLGIRIAKRRSLEQVLNLVSKEQDGEKFDDALARVRRCVGGGTESNNADSDSDIEVVADSVSVSLRCPMTALKIKIAGRFKPCAHMGCFDLEAFIEINRRSRKWQCPICLKNYSLQNIIIDPYFNRITSLIKSCGDDDISEVDVKPDGSWRVKGRAELKDLAQWHLPDGTLCVATDTAAKPKMCTVKHEVKEEPLPEEVGCSLKLGIKKNSNGKWEINKKGDTASVLSPDIDHARHMGNKTLTCSTDGTNIGDEGCNSEPARNDYPRTYVHDLDSSASDENVPPASAEQDVIVLSDSDDDAVTVLSPSAMIRGSAHDDTGNLFPPNPPETSLVSLKEGFDDLGLSFWERPPSPADDPSYQMFDEPVSVVDLGVKAVAVGDGHDGTLQPCTSGERDGAISLANLGNHTQACDEGTAAGTNEGSANSQDESRKRRNSGDGTTAALLDGSGVGSRTGSDGLAEAALVEGRSVRPRLVLNIDSDSDD